MTDDEFIEAFEAMSIPRDDWSHEAHIRMAWIYCQREECCEAATNHARAGIKALNKANNTPGKLYHETVTVAFMTLVWHRATSGDAEGWAVFLRENADLVDPKTPILRTYYSNALLESEEAHTQFVMPDRVALPG